MDTFKTCRDCGNCCKKTTPLVSTDDIKRWRKEKRVDVLSGIEKYYLWHTVMKNKGVCVFYDNNSGRCKIHETKPQSCAFFPHDIEGAKKVGCKLI